jgi:hypothetical protein
MGGSLKEEESLSAGFSGTGLGPTAVNTFLVSILTTCSYNRNGLLTAVQNPLSQNVSLVYMLATGTAIEIQASGAATMPPA